ncbi:MAG TPA: RnfABCDGE type electron transport complex subunit D [bacterium]|nr:RnfABCDGE type electron transport complex subunit D [bacterium]HMW36587.1 RnfABCDGE type electron transport complex subunit D [bacterium]HMZ04685.1 RnfABCDGE type electron transport complex subunit D [bacterium]HNB09106.1 RnfABCDGE type electron transport complex subunit D [bacterium]HND75677.1 RnfABCDGE type electron transport complex subunit D [bacterium]
MSTSPFLHDEATTPWIMRQVIYALVPVAAAAYYFFGLSVILLSVAAVSGCLFAEWLLSGSNPRHQSLFDGSALLTGLLLALTLPPGFPMWMAFLGGLIAIMIGKYIWGGLGQNIFNPALVGRAFLQAAFPTAITTWSVPDGRYFSARGTNLAWPFFHGEPLDAISSATPLSSMKFQHEATELSHLMLGHTSGSLGETCGVIILLAGVYLAYRKIFNWHIPVSIIAATVVLSGILYIVNPILYPSPMHMLFSGGLMLGAVFMATDPVTSPMTVRGMWIFGSGIGILVVLIRIFGGLPEGVMYAILLMNAVTPLINRVTRHRVYGTK